MERLVGALVRVFNRLLVLVVALMVAFAVYVVFYSVQTTQTARSGGTAATVTLDDAPAYFLGLVNVARHAANQPPFRYSPQLTQVAQGYANYYAGIDTVHQIDGGRIISDLNAQRYYVGRVVYQMPGSVEAMPLAEALRHIQRTHAAQLNDVAVRDLGFGAVQTDDGGLYYMVLAAYQEARAADAGAEAGGPSQEAQQAEILRLLNAARAERGLLPLRVDPRLTAAAYAHSVDMANRGRMGHDGSDGSMWDERARRHGYPLSLVGENVLVRPNRHAGAAYGQWWNSPPHRENMLFPDFRDIGIAYAISPDGHHYYTMLLGG